MGRKHSHPPGMRPRKSIPERYVGLCRAQCSLAIHTTLIRHGGRSRSGRRWPCRSLRGAPPICALYVKPEAREHRRRTFRWCPAPTTLLCWKHNSFNTKASRTFQQVPPSTQQDTNPMDALVRVDTRSFGVPMRELSHGLDTSHMKINAACRMLVPRNVKQLGSSWSARYDMSSSPENTRCRQTWGLQ